MEEPGRERVIWGCRMAGSGEVQSDECRVQNEENSMRTSNVER